MIVILYPHAVDELKINVWTCYFAEKHLIKFFNQQFLSTMGNFKRFCLFITNRKSYAFVESKTKGICIVLKNISQKIE